MHNMDELLKGMDAKTLEKNMQKANDFAKTKEGKAVIEKLKKSMPEDKDGLIKMLSQNPDMIKSIENFFKS